MLEFAMLHSFGFIVSFGLLFAVIGMMFRNRPAHGSGRFGRYDERQFVHPDRDNLVYADGFQGATIATFLVVALTVYYIEDPRLFEILKGQASLVALYALLGCLQSADRFRRSLHG